MLDPLLAASLAALLLAQANAGAAAGPGAEAARVAAETRPRMAAAAGIEPLAGFVENRGQWPAEALFLARAGAVEATVLCDGFVLRPLPAFGAHGRAVRDTAPLVVRFAGGACAADVVGVEPGPTKHHFFQATGSASDALGYASVRFEEVWPGVDVVLRREADVFAYDLHLAPGAELAGVALEFRGASGASIEDGALVLDTPEGPVEQRFGAAWQEDAHGVRTPVAPRFTVDHRADKDRAMVGFGVPARDPAQALVIDPTLVYATYVGGSASEQQPRIAADTEGNAYLTCRTGPGMPVTPGAFDSSYAGVGTDAWVGKLSSDGSTLLWGTYLGGVSTDQPEDIACAPDGTVVVLGQTWSDEFPTTANALQTLELGLNDTFLTRLSPDGSQLVWSTRLGSTDADLAKALACSPSNELIVVLEPWAADVTGLPALGFDAVWDEGDHLVARISADGTAVLAATWLKADRLLDLALDGEGSVYVGGDAAADGSPVTPTAHQSGPPAAPGVGSGYAAKLSADLSELVYGTHLGGDGGGTTVWGIAVDGAGCLHVAAQCGAEDSPVTPGAWQPVLQDPSAGYLAKLLPRGTDLAWATFLGDWTLNGSGYPASAVLDAAGCAIAVGWANTPGWPVTQDAFQNSFVGPFPSGDAALTKLDPVGEQLVYSTWLGGTGSEAFTRVAARGPGTVAVAMSTTSPNFPVTAGAYDTVKDPNSDCAVAAFDLGLAPWRILGPGTMGSIETPNLVGLGSNTPGSPTRLALRGALPSVPVFLIAGGFEVNLPVFGGTLVPFPELVLPMTTSALGWKDFQFSWPPLLPGQDLTLQFWCLDPQDPWGWSASNGLRALAQ